MKILVKVKANSKVKKVEKVSENEFVLRVKAPAKEGKANAAAIELLSEYFDTPKSRITIIKGQTSTVKIIDLSR